MLCFTIRNSYTGRFVADSYLRIKTFSSIWSAERYMELCKLKPEVYKIVPISVQK